MADDDKRIQFDREKVVFEQNCSQIRTLIQELHKKPTMSATITGGLITVISVFKIEDRYVIWLLALISLLNAFISITCLRIRDVIESYLEKTSRFSPNFGTKGGRPTNPILPWVGAFSVSIGYAFMTSTISIAAIAAPFVVFGLKLQSFIPFFVTAIGVGLYVIFSYHRDKDLHKNRTIEYYNRNWDEYIRKTKSIDMSDIRERFLRVIPEGGRILDVGAGSGRDAQEFLKLGFPTVALEPTPAFANLLREIPDLEVIQVTAQDLEQSAQFDGIWACASLLHLDDNEMNRALKRLQRALKPGGHIYISVQDGARNEQTKDGIHFHDLTMQQLRDLISECRMKEVDSWSNPPRASGENQSSWNNIIAKKPD